MRYFLFVNNSFILPIVSTVSVNASETCVVLTGGVQKEPFMKKYGEVIEWNGSSKALEELAIARNDRIIVAVSDIELRKETMSVMREIKIPSPIILLEETERPLPRCSTLNVAGFDIGKIAGAKLADEWKLLDTNEKACLLRKALSCDGKILILTQNDPDPDAISCAMAIQALTRRTSSTAPICTFGKITRSENLTMTLLLGTTVRTITSDDLKNFERVVMVDTQPPYFEDGLFDYADAVIDHHPYPQNYKAAFRDIDVSYGSTSAKMYEYLEATKTPITWRLATALLYGIITDTMFLARETSMSDFTAFSALWPKADSHILSNMSRPRLDADELSYFVRAIKNRKIVGNFLLMWLGNIKREDIVPRLADFSLQVGATTWSAVCGIYDGDLIISVRSMDSEINAGKLVSSIFSDMGSAGGHQSMAKAVIPIEHFMKDCGLSSTSEVSEKLIEMFQGGVSAND